MVGRTKPIKPADRVRFQAIKSMRCAACEKTRHFGSCGPTEAHHILHAGRRIGHQATIPLGSYHHRAVPLPGFTLREMEASFGPSLARLPRKFREKFPESELLAMTNAKLASLVPESA